MIRHKSIMMSDVWKSMWISGGWIVFASVFGLWINGGLKKIVNTCLLSLQKHKNILHSILLQFSPNLLFYTVLKHQIRPFPTLPPRSNLFHRSPAASPDRLARPGGIPPFYRRSKQRNNAIAARIGGDSKNYKLSDNFKKPYSYFTSTPSPKSPPPSHLYQKSSHFTYPSPLPSNQPF